ncbi:hypothetical protein [Rhizobium tumorigenes]|uniref:hypothetical protein n=1 Tax=Rhizobium tumorigenes TaxID=2041385 RepID=UPI00242007BF|nr:hypothetical protein [Rhizobium tumorigenes]WFS02376.1 hypothetical protein PR016_07120 [Rhizobium tumorigenes]
MTRISHTVPTDDVVRKPTSSQIFYPLSTVRCVGQPAFRSQHARDYACLLDVDEGIASWTCVTPRLIHDEEVHDLDFVVTPLYGRRFLADVCRKLPDPPDWVPDAAEAMGYDYRPVAGGELSTGFRLRNARDLLRYGFYKASLGDRVRLLAALDEMGTLTVAECLAAFIEGKPMASLASMAFHGFISIDLDDSLIGPETVVRRIRA